MGAAATVSGITVPVDAAANIAVSKAVGVFIETFSSCPRRDRNCQGFIPGPLALTHSAGT
jgi:hypothetical protein